MKRKQIRSIHGLIEAGGVARTGAATHGEAINLYHNKEDAIALNLSEFIEKHAETEHAKELLFHQRATSVQTETAAQRLVMQAREVSM